MLVDRLGAAKAYWLMTAGLVIVGLIAAIVVAIKAERDERKDQVASAQLIETAAAEAVTQMPIALAAAALSTQAGASTALSLARVLGRHWPLVMLVGGIGALVWSSDGAIQYARKSSRRALEQRWRWFGRADLNAGGSRGRTRELRCSSSAPPQRRLFALDENLFAVRGASILCGV
jgi:hypothetical protein